MGRQALNLTDGSSWSTTARTDGLENLIDELLSSLTTKERCVVFESKLKPSIFFTTPDIQVELGGSGIEVVGRNLGAIDGQGAARRVLQSKHHVKQWISAQVSFGQHGLDQLFKRVKLVFASLKDPLFDHPK